eukprot:5403011-Amphidinium_carterae.1
MPGLLRERGLHFKLESSLLGAVPLCCVEHSTVKADPWPADEHPSAGRIQRSVVLRRTDHSSQCMKMRCAQFH